MITQIFRIFDLKKAQSFYIDYLGFKLDWNHQS
jgi:catechol 2,3-dioxygenase-like lactoylglutathione lyase family enzyme